MKNIVHHIIHKNTFWLSHQRCIFWEEQNALILSDLHFGKTAHFRKSGIGIPQNIFKEDLQRLFHQVQFYQPKKLIIVGDLFHSRENKEMDFFLRWRNDFASVEMLLVKGNHDILEDEWYNAAGIKVSGNKLQIAGFDFVHDIAAGIINSPLSTVNYSFSGHIHPGINIKTGSRQSLSFPCFYFGEKYAVLPAFGKFTGIALIKPKKNETVYAIVNDALVKM